ncbi:MAG: chemotaxis protein CheW [Dethiobacteria bacterium]
MDDYRDLFLAEAREYLQDMTNCLLRLEKKPDDTNSLTEMFRAAHSLKGMAATMGYELITELTHELENMFDQLRNGELSIGTDLVSLLFKAVDMINLLVDNLDNQEIFRQESKTLQQDLIQWHELLNGAGKNKPGLVGFPPDPKNISSDILNEFEKEVLKDATSREEKCYYIRVYLLDGVLLKSVRAHMVCKAVEKMGEIIKTVPSMQDLENENFDLTFSLLLYGKPDLKDLEKSIISIAEIERVEISQIKINGKQENVFVVEQDPVTRGMHKPAIPVESEMAQQEQAAAVAVLDKEDAVNFSKIRAGSTATRAVEKTVRVETAKLDTLVNLVGELIINRTRVVELGKKAGDELLESSLQQLERITTELQGAAMTLRMVPIKQVFDRFPRMIRDLSVEKGKKLELIITGEETELDRTIVNQIGDPLVHLLRNAVDHGIEDEEERKRKGKNPVGKIYLNAHHEGSHVVVCVEDDGIGINADFIRARALEKNIIKKNELDNLTQEEIIRLIFQSGFSTSSVITDVSGRGVGMDVVKTAIEALNGDIEVKSEPEKGTKFIIRLPLTLAIIRTLMVRDEGEIFAIPIEAIRENLFVGCHEIKTIQQGRVITLRDEVLPLYFLKEKLKLGSVRQQNAYPVVVIQSAEKKAGLAVDELLGQQEIVIKSLNGFVSDIKGIAGATVLGDGRVSLILDIAGLLDMGGVNFGKESIDH